MYEYIEKNIKEVRDRLGEAALKNGRRPEEIKLVAVSKTFPAEIVKAAVGFGMTDLGESRIQDAEPKIEKLGDIAAWHMIGHLQTNKAKRAVELFPIIQSLDSIRLAEELEKRAGNIDKKIDCLIELNSSGEESKYGFTPDRILEALRELKDYRYLDVRGVMTIGPYVENENEIRRAFQLTRSLLEKGKEIIGDKFDTLSMGMSSDFELAVAEGSNMVRIGTAIFGPRKK